MATTPLFGYNPASIAAPVAEYGIMGGGGSGRQVFSWYIKMVCTVAESLPGLGTLLLTLKYWDGAAMQPLQVSLNLATIGDSTFGGAQFQDIWLDFAGDPVSGFCATLEFSYIGPGGTDGAADVTIDLVDQ